MAKREKIPANKGYTLLWDFTEYWKRVFVVKKGKK